MHKNYYKVLQNNQNETQLDHKEIKTDHTEIQKDHREIQYSPVNLWKIAFVIILSFMIPWDIQKHEKCIPLYSYLVVSWELKFGFFVSQCHTVECVFLFLNMLF